VRGAGAAAPQHCAQEGARAHPRRSRAAESVVIVPLKLLGSWASSYTHRMQLSLRLKGLEFKYAEEDLGNKSKELQEKAERASVGKKYQMY
jgi:hypothetical protein